MLFGCARQDVLKWRLQKNGQLPILHKELCGGDCWSCTEKDREVLGALVGSVWELGWFTEKDDVAGGATTKESFGGRFGRGALLILQEKRRNVRCSVGEVCGQLWVGIAGPSQKFLVLWWGALGGELWNFLLLCGKPKNMFDHDWAVCDWWGVLWWGVVGCRLAPLILIGVLACSDGVSSDRKLWGPKPFGTEHSAQKKIRWKWGFGRFWANWVLAGRFWARPPWAVLWWDLRGAKRPPTAPHQSTLYQSPRNGTIPIKNVFLFTTHHHHQSVGPRNGPGLINNVFFWLTAQNSLPERPTPEHLRVVFGFRNGPVLINNGLFWFAQKAIFPPERLGRQGSQTARQSCLLHNQQSFGPLQLPTRNLHEGNKSSLLEELNGLPQPR